MHAHSICAVYTCTCCIRTYTHARICCIRTYTHARIQLAHTRLSGWATSQSLRSTSAVSAKPTCRRRRIMLWFDLPHTAEHTQALRSKSSAPPSCCFRSSASPNDPSGDHRGYVSQVYDTYRRHTHTALHAAARLQARPSRKRSPQRYRRLDAQACTPGGPRQACTPSSRLYIDVQACTPSSRLYIDV
jgi:hypothetical protein